MPLHCERAVLAGAAVREKLRSTVATRDRADDVVTRQEAIDMTALRALRESPTDVEALDLTADLLRRLQDVSDRTMPTQCAGMRPDDQQAHRLQTWAQLAGGAPGARQRPQPRRTRRGDSREQAPGGWFAGHSLVQVNR
ncbi:hypothetical protein ACFY8K_28730 [Streptomyces misionensis]|uniref:hypothetical protein n=1 Tax=Streptomyces misionensis TaxID=67331 RepID=UPI0036A2B382